MPKPVPTVQPGRIWTVPNLISVSRLVLLLPLTVVFLLNQHYSAALVSIVLLGVTDWLDGFLARQFDLATEFGKSLDPWADRISIVVLGATLMIDGLLPWPLVLAIVATDLALGILGLAWFGGAPQNLKVSLLGKARTAALLLSMPLLVLYAATGIRWIWVLGVVLCTVATVGHVIAGFQYWREMYLMHRQNLLGRVLATDQTPSAELG